MGTPSPNPSTIKMYNVKQKTWNKLSKSTSEDAFSNPHSEAA